MIKWDYSGEDDTCDCGERLTNEHLMYQGKSDFDKLNCTRGGCLLVVTQHITPSDNLVKYIE